MQRKIINPTYSYRGDGAVTFNCIAQLLGPSSEIVAEVQCSSIQNLRVVGWKTAIAADIKRAVDEYEAALLDTLGRAQQEFPGVESIEGIVVAMASHIEEVCNGVG